MTGQAIALDIGTSGLRGQLLDLRSGMVLRTCVATRNPLPGANVMDHLTFAVERGADPARRILLDAVHELAGRLRPDSLERVAVCGNPIQLSLFGGTEFRDLAYAGDNKLASENIPSVDRSGRIVPGDTAGFPSDVDVVIPPAVRHEIGADALAMMLESGFLDDDMCMVTDYGTNAEMALKVGDDIYTGSAAAGPALEGQQIGSGMLAGPGALSDLVRTPEGWRMKVLDGNLEARDGPLLSIRNNMVRGSGLKPVGITGTGVVALLYAGMADDCISPPRIRRGPLCLGRGIRFTEGDLAEAGKAVGALRAGQMTLINEAGVSFRDVRTMYMAGATGTYVDPEKAKSVGISPPGTSKVVQVGNTSLGLARRLAADPDMLDGLNAMRRDLLAKHVMFASSPTFSDLYVMELAYWTEGMPLDAYRAVLGDHGLEGYLDGTVPSAVERRCVRDIADMGESLDIFRPGTAVGGAWDCRMCMLCVRACPEGALSFDGGFRVDTGLCLGTACCRCEEACPEGSFRQSRLSLVPRSGRSAGDSRDPSAVVKKTGRARRER